MRKLRAILLLPVVLSLAGCGGTPPSGPTQRISPTPVPTPTPTPTPTPSPTPDPRAGLAPGPVITFTIGIRSVDTGGFNYRQPTQNADGEWELFVGEFVVYDGIPRNGAGARCTYVNDPAYNLSDPDGAVNVRGSSNLFLFRTDIVRPGEFTVRAVIDGVDSNVISVIARRAP